MVYVSTVIDDALITKVSIRGDDGLSENLTTLANVGRTGDHCAGMDKRRDAQAVVLHHFGEVLADCARHTTNSYRGRKVTGRHALRCKPRLETGDTMMDWHINETGRHILVIVEQRHHDAPPKSD